ncbi:short-chain dehydrogenase [Mycobacterium heckeshornense]|uniref:SDR family NAD(P)-dependent oxidoreductase n=1 Tax=Mycobacterium heckeshornense TaxID=110505 RepID=UPI001943A881|nr:SDR family oxidoreductase [Mycobacterium heckeshornense]BCQ07833.1 short-chain dehydrogenase [Mycobacterium heckeshornense]
MPGIEGRGYLIAGAASGIGLAACKRLVSAGASVAMLDLDARKLRAEAAKLSNNGNVVALRCDVGDETCVRSVVETAAAQLGTLHGAVTSAGVFDPGDLVEVEALEMSVFERVIGVNLRGTLLVLRAVLPLLAKGGSVVTVASTAGLRGHGMGPSYTCSKGGVIALTRLAAYQYGRKGIRVNCVCPGATAGEGMGAAFADEATAAWASADLPLRRVGRADEVGATIAALLSDDTSYLTGQIIAVDGGATIR